LPRSGYCHISSVLTVQTGVPAQNERGRLAAEAVGTGLRTGSGMSDRTLVVVSDSERDRILNTAVAAYAREGWTISAIFAGQAIAQRKGPLFGSVVWINVVFTLICFLLTIVSAGLFLIVLLVMYLNRDNESVIITVDEYGRRTIS
jgi:hypothetical protein